MITAKTHTKLFILFLVTVLTLGVLPAHAGCNLANGNALQLNVSGDFIIPLGDQADYTASVQAGVAGTYAWSLGGGYFSIVDGSDQDTVTVQAPAVYDANAPHIYDPYEDEEGENMIATLNLTFTFDDSSLGSCGSAYIVETPPAPPPPTVTVTIDNPADVMCVGSSKDFTATVSPQVEGTFSWTTSSGKITLANASEQTVTVNAGSSHSDAVDAEDLTVVFTPAEGDACQATHNFTVIEVELVNPEDILLVDSSEDFTATVSPQVAGTYSWTTTSSKITLANTSAQTVTVNAGSTPSDSVDAEELTLEFAPDGGDACEVLHNLTVVKVGLKKLEFTSDHNVICNGTTLTSAGSRYPNVEWDTTLPNPVNAPITHTAGTNAAGKIALTLTLDVSPIPASTVYTITGTSSEDALSFSKSGSISSGSSVTISVTADNSIGGEVRKIEDSISWTIELLGITVNLGDTGDHVIYTTLGTPNTSAPSSASVPNVPRMDLAVPIVASAITAAGGDGNHTKTVWEIVKAEGSYTLGTSLNDVDAWTLPSLSNGADCLSISKFVRNVGMATGIPGGFDAETYAAYYRTAGEPDRPKTAIAGLALNNPYVNSGDQGAAATAGLDPAWVLGLADINCTKFGGGSAPGTVGCGPDGLNAFEAAMIYTDTAAKKWYFPGGTPKIYDDIDDIVQIFQTMVWVGLGDHDGNPATPDVAIVKSVDYTYTTQPNATP
ncbi:MAG: hypothetical protein JW713_05780 [Pontiellaceae bacterium]|nr:hypothetical protein [Pontiellaceae bacterium]